VEKHVNPRLLEILVCPLCKGPLVYDKAAQELICKGDRLAYLWADQARDLNDTVSSDTRTQS